MKKLRDFDLREKKVLVRSDFNVPLDASGNILDDFRIRKSLPTINYLRNRRAKTILISHWKEGQSLKKIIPEIENLLTQKIAFARNCVARTTKMRVNRMKPGDIILLENLRFHKEEKANDPNFAKKLAKLADIYINDAFAVSHRAHASLVGVPALLPSGIGFLFEQEIQAMSEILKRPKRPLVGIVGGAKVESKIKPINEFLEKVDFLLIGGKIADIILRAKGLSISKPLPEPEIIEEIENFKLTNPKLRLPLDVVVALEGVYVRNTGPAGIRKDESVFDIGPETIKLFSRIIQDAKTIFWAGPLGKIEEQRFTTGTLEIAKAITKTKAYSIVGGRETVSFLSKHNFADKFSYVSTAGGAMLEYLSKGTLPAIEALE